MAENAVAAEPVEAAPHRVGAVNAAIARARDAGLSGLILIAPDALPDHPTPFLLASAVREGGDAPDAVAASLVEAVGVEALASLAVGWVDCLAAAGRDALEREVAAVAGVAGGVLVIEGDTPAADALISLGADLPGRVEARRSGTGVSAVRVLAAGASMARTARRRRPPRPLRVAMWDWYGKSRPLASAVEGAGGRMVEDPASADVALINNDFPGLGRLDFLDACVDAGGRALLYPDGASPNLMAAWDGLYTVYRRLSGILMTAPGHAEIARRYGYPHPVHTIGWSYCAQRPRRAVSAPRRILLAPEHPPYHGKDESPRRNAAAFRALLAMPGIELLVRHIGEIEENGLWHEPGVRYHRGDQSDFDEMLAQIDAADVVVNEGGTFTGLAVARGVAAVTWDTTTQQRHVEPFDESRHIARYREYMSYPFDLASGAPLDELVHAAARDTDLVGEWRERFIGPPLDPAALMDALAG